MYYFGLVEDVPSSNTQEIISLGRGLMWDDATVFDERVGLKILVRDSFEMWKCLNRKSNMMFSDPLVFWDCRDTSLLMRVHSDYRDTV